MGGTGLFSSASGGWGMGSTQATREYRERKRAAGLCYEGGYWQKATRGGRCDEHAETDAAPSGGAAGREAAPGTRRAGDGGPAGRYPVGLGNPLCNNVFGLVSRICG